VPAVLDAAEARLSGWRGKGREAIRGSGYVMHSATAALWAFSNAADFREAVLLAANLGEDADTTAAITGQLAGAAWGASGIPAEWLERLKWRERIEEVALNLAEAGLAEGI
jgi:ADP-ribosyl-[dinitrogen reductase] hydrolase